MSEKLTLPAGEIIYLGLKYRSLNYNKTKEIYTVQVMFDESHPGVLEAKKALEAINPDLIGPGRNSKRTVPPGFFTLRASTEFEVPVHIIEDGKRLPVPQDEMPDFNKDCSGGAVLTVSPFTSKAGGGINLTAVDLVNLNIVESANSSSGSLNEEEILAKAASYAALKQAAS